MGVAAMPAPKCLGAQNPSKELAHFRVLLGNLLSQNRVPKLSDPGHPLNVNHQVCAGKVRDCKGHDKTNPIELLGLFHA